MKRLLMAIIIIYPGCFIWAQNSYSISGELRQWHRVSITFNGPETSESANPNPFTDCRLNVTFTNADTTYTVPGYYAADGNAGNTGAQAGNKWRVNFSPDRQGWWRFKASFRTGPSIAVNSDENAGSASAFNGASDSFFVLATNKRSPDFKSKGTLRYAGKHFLRFAGTGEYYLKGGTDSPENFLGYYEFDQTPQNHRFAPHANDYRTGDPLWMGGKGKNIVGAINYLSSKGMNVIYMLTFNAGGDGKDVWPWTGRDERLRFDCSKLDQWDMVFSHMQSKGIVCHFVTQEIENDKDLDGGNLGNTRKLYYRELIARFAHNPAVIWNLGEENSNTDVQRKDFAKYIHQTDPYGHMVTVHNILYEQVFKPLQGYPWIDGASIYIEKTENAHIQTLKFLRDSERAARPWVCFIDEITPDEEGALPDENDYWHDRIRKQVLWGNLMAGGAGVEWYMGYNYPNNDLTLEDFRSRDHLWDLTRYAVEFFRKYLPFSEMKNSDSLITSGNGYCMALSDSIYSLYLPSGGSASIRLEREADYVVRWYNPRTGGSLRQGSIDTIKGPGIQSIGFPQTDRNNDWAALISMKGTALPPDTTLPPPPAESFLRLSVYPNPFAAGTTLSLSVPEKVRVKIKVYDSIGRLTAVVMDMEIEAGEYMEAWNASGVSSGIYFIQAETPKERTVQKVMVIK